ncbi:MAG: 2-oxoacid:acceptor oxidoreductase family protein [candidate division KSB1 bacterium]|nr:2-oxoacid:acceptor oxidoreductase family protein [candidate division KSB1 bacterium]MDZ7335610.1 2-oxoacid:acceptor oxidoreductase family protein [candidate division KSB1 bacterium]MDZ7357580.1 2-oxoacid:acceptor oxidoreductase family protein [candidate division KSB1 bacterium]MDZ7399762.1 2-oxoacid:acceptor oxidoreductase family protein [candidate division KSB1 bacterium]
MANLIEVRWHGRGGQGAKTAALLLAEAAIAEGKYGQAFPEYGPERTGAPVRGFTRISDEPIRIHSAIQNPDVVIVLDQTLLDTIDVTEGTKPNSILIFNTTMTKEEIKKKLKASDRKIFLLNANQIAQEELGRPIPNTVMLGALMKATGLMQMDTLVKGLTKKFMHKFSQQVIDKNIRAVKRAYEEVKEI